MGLRLWSEEKDSYPVLQLQREVCVLAGVNKRKGYHIIYEDIAVVKKTSVCSINH